MTVGQKIRALRKEKHLTQKQLGDLLGITPSAVGQFETNAKPPKIETLEKIAIALGVPITYLLGEGNQLSPDIAIDQKLQHVGFSIGFDEDNAAIWINYPDGYLEVTEAELKALNSNVNNYLLFQLEQLKNTHGSEFRYLK